MGSALRHIVCLFAGLFSCLLCELASPTTPPTPPQPATLAACPSIGLPAPSLTPSPADAAGVYLLPFRGLHSRGCSSNTFHSTASAQWRPPPPHTHRHPAPHSVTSSSRLFLLPFAFCLFFLLCTWSSFSSPLRAYSAGAAPACKWTPPS